MGVATLHAQTVTVGWEPAKNFCYGSFYCGQLLSQTNFHKKSEAISKLKVSVTANFCGSFPHFPTFATMANMSETSKLLGCLICQTFALFKVDGAT